MMDGIGQYILSVIVGAMICTIAVSMVPSSQGKTWIRLICGLILSLIVIKPLVSFRLSDLDFSDPMIWSDGESFIESGERQTKESLSSIIKQQCETYILDKANSLGVHVEAEVMLSDDQIPLPVSVTLQGEAAPYHRLQLEGIIQEDLGITKENLRWME